MNPLQALELAQQRQLDLRADRRRLAPRQLAGPVGAASLRSAPHSAAASAVRARRATGWFLVDVGLRLAVAGETAGLSGPREADGGLPSAALGE